MKKLNYKLLYEEAIKELTNSKGICSRIPAYIAYCVKRRVKERNGNIQCRACISNHIKNIVKGRKKRNVRKRKH